MQKKQKLILIITAIFTLIILGVAYYILQAKYNNHYFNNLSARTETLYAGQADAMHVEHSSGDLNKSCYRSEQGPFDNGKQWCGISVDKKIAVTPNAAILGAFVVDLQDALKKQEFDVSSEGLGSDLLVGFTVEANLAGGASSKLCTVRAEYHPNTAYADAKTTIDYKLSCNRESSTIVPGFDNDN